MKTFFHLKKTNRKSCEKALKAARFPAVFLLLISSYFLGTCAGFIQEQLSVRAGQRSAFLPSENSWGLSFQNGEGNAPAGNASAEELASYDAFYVQETEEKVIYLTFDAGYENGNTSSILDTLKKHHAPAAFFVVGTYIESEPELVRRMHEEGHIVGNHTWHHPDMADISSPDAFRKELEDVEKAYQKATGCEMTKYYRPPRGCYSEENLKMAQSFGYRTFFWSLAYVDWYENDQPTKEEAFQKLVGRIHPGAIVLLHSTSDTNAQILDDLLSEWESLGYRFRPLSDLAGSGVSST